MAFSTEEHGKIVNKYWSSNCPACSIKERCTTSQYRRVARWEHEDVPDRVQDRLDAEPERMRIRKVTVASFWYDQVMDGVDTLPDENAKTREYRDEFACTRLQFEACDEYPGCRAVYPGDTDIAPGSCSRIWGSRMLERYFPTTIKNW
jgi:hypothetical protein